MAEWYFIQGIHRSGTTILGTWLQETGTFRTLTLGDIINISQDPVLSARFEPALKGGITHLRNLRDALGNLTREFDDIRVTRDLFEEYAHLTMSKPPFSRWLNLLRLQKPWNQFNPKYVFKLGRDNIERFMAMSQIIGRGDDRPQLFKNPFDVANPFVYGLEAKHIFIFRDPIDILSSMVRQVRENYRRKNPYIYAVSRFYRESYRGWWYRLASLYGVSTPFGVRVLARRIITELNAQMDLMSALDKNQYVCVDYDFMCRDEDSSASEGHPRRDHTVSHILRFFGLDTKGIVKIKSRTKRRINRLPAMVSNLKPYLEKKLPLYLDKMTEVRENLEREFRERQ